MDSSPGKPESAVHSPRESSAPQQSLPKTPSKKWSFINPLNIRHSASPGRHEPSTLKSSAGWRKQSAKGTPPFIFKGIAIITRYLVEAWQNIQRDAMAAETSLTSLSSLGFLPEASPPISPSQPSGSTTAQKDEQPSPCPFVTTSNLNAAQASHFDAQISQGSPTFKVPSRDAANKRLIPSSIPFFRRVSSHSMQTPPGSSAGGISGSPTSSSAPNTHQSGLRVDSANLKERPLTSPTTPGTAHRNSSMLSLGLSRDRRFRHYGP